MSNRPDVTTRPLTRQKLAAVLGDKPEQIRAFEAMLDDVSGVLPDAVQVAADAAEAAALDAAAALAATVALDTRVDVLEAQPVGHVIEDEGAVVTQRGTLNFTGSGVTVTDAGGKTVVAITGGGGGGGSSYFPGGW